MFRILAAGFAVLLVTPTVAGERTVRLAVDNMTCVACPLMVKRTLAAVPGVIAVEVSFKERTARVSFDDSRIGADALTSATAGNGFPSQLVE